MQTSHHLRTLSLDPHLHRLRLRIAIDRLRHLLPLRPSLRALQPPHASIYLTRTDLVARQLGRSLVRIRLQRSLQRRPPVAVLVSHNILPPECCRLDRRSGEIVWGDGVAGALVERKRRVEKEQIKEGLRVWLERKAREIGMRTKEGGVGVMVWRFSRKIRGGGEGPRRRQQGTDIPRTDQVEKLKRYWEGMVSSR